MKKILDRSIIINTTCQNTYTALRCLIDNSYYAQIAEEITRNDPNDPVSIRSYLNEYCTVKICTARQCGHTSSLCNIAIEYFDKAIFLSPNFAMSERLNTAFLNLLFLNDVGPGYTLKETKSEIVTNAGKRFLFGAYNSLDRFRGVSTEAVFIDGTFDITPKKEDEIYGVLAPCMKNYPQRFFIFVQ